MLRTRWLAALLACASASAQVFVMTKEDLAKYTAANPFDRLPDGRPKVPDALMEKAKGLSVEEVWGVVGQSGTGFKNQYSGGWQIMHPDKKLVGRAFTVQFMPARADVRDVVEKEALAQGKRRSSNQRIIDMLQPGDVVVVDLYGKVEGGTFVGDNLAAAVWSATKTGMVVDGGVRDLEGIHPLGMPVYHRGGHPSAMAFEDVMLTGVNVPVRIGNTTVMPGDLVFGDRTGIYFVPPQFIQKIVDRAEETHLHDEWTKQKFMTGQYKSSDLYPTPTDPKLKAEYEEFKKQRLKK